MTIGKYGFSDGAVDDVGLPAIRERYFRLGENNRITSGQTFSVNRKLNSICYTIYT